MAEKYRFFDAVLQEDGVTYDREYDAQEFTDYFKALVTTGLMKGAGNQLAVTANGSNMITKVDTGIAFLLGRYYENDSFKELTHDTETLGNSRIDRIVIRMDLSTEARYVKAFIKKGVPSANPVPPALTQTPNLYEISLAQVRVVGGQTFIAANAVTDERGKDVICPWAGSNIIPNFDDDALQALMNRFMGANLRDLGITDLNDVMESGTYFYDDPSMGNRPTGIFPQLNGVYLGDILVVRTGESGALIQEIDRNSNGTTRKPIKHFRGYYDGVWGQWYQPIDSYTLNPSSKSVYVNGATGSDTTGDGSAAKPWKSISYALAVQSATWNGNRYIVYIQSGTYNETIQIFQKFGGAIELRAQNGAVTVGFIDIMSVDRLVMVNIQSNSGNGMEIVNCPDFYISGYNNTATSNISGIRFKRSRGMMENSLVSYKTGTGVAAYDAMENSNVYLYYCQGGGNTIGLQVDGSVIRRGAGTSVSATTPTRVVNAGQIL